MINLKIKTHDSDISSDILSRVEKAFVCALDCFERVIREIEVTLIDMNGPKGGVDKRCTVQVRLYPRGLAVVRCNGSSALEAANDACDKIRQAIAKRLDKQKSRSHNEMLNLMPAVES